MPIWWIQTLSLRRFFEVRQSSILAIFATVPPEPYIIYLIFKAYFSKYRRV
jgi:hypothetical protein